MAERPERQIATICNSLFTKTDPHHLFSSTIKFKAKKQQLEKGHTHTENSFPILKFKYFHTKANPSRITRKNNIKYSDSVKCFWRQEKFVKL